MWIVNRFQIGPLILVESAGLLKSSWFALRDDSLNDDAECERRAGCAGRMLRGGIALGWPAQPALRLAKGD